MLYQDSLDWLVHRCDDMNITCSSCHKHIPPKYFDQSIQSHFPIPYRKSTIKLVLN